MEAPMSAIAKVFMSGRSQAVRLPKEFRLDAKEVRVRRVGKTLVLEPIEHDVDKWFAELDALGGDFPEREQPPMPADDIDFDRGFERKSKR
jgi:antitoxin VapB